jgi:hypothetical protein
MGSIVWDVGNGKCEFGIRAFFKSNTKIPPLTSHIEIELCPNTQYNIIKEEPLNEKV